MKHFQVRRIASALLIVAVTSPTLLYAQPGSKDVLIKSNLVRGFDLGVDTGPNQMRNWLKKESDGFKMEFPSRQDWAAVFITAGKPAKQGMRLGIDLSSYSVLSVELKGESGGEKIEIGIKSNRQKDDGSEEKVPIIVTSEWAPYRIPLSKFLVGDLKDLKQIYVVTEFVYTGSTPQAVYFRNIKYLEK